MGLVSAETVSGHFGDEPSAGFAWLLKVVGVIIAFLLWRIASRGDARACRRDVYHTCLALSVALLLAIPLSRMGETYFEFSSARYLALSYLLFLPGEALLLFLFSRLPDRGNSPGCGAAPSTPGPGSCKTKVNTAEDPASKESDMPASPKRVFIGHGRAPDWRELKDFVQDRLGLPCDEFNRVPTAGDTTVARLTQMLDSAAAALLVLTAEDERVDGVLQARMNVVHEVGLFQGRLGFKKAILLIEDGCAEFSNVHGLGQIRYPKGSISAAFEEVRHVLERERLVRAAA
jgi:hypothetical protein